MDKNSYQIVLNDLETDKTKLQADCDDLKKQYDDKLQEVSRIESAVEVIRARLKIEFSTDTKVRFSNENKFNQVAAISSESPDKTQNETDAEAMPPTKFNKENQNPITLGDGCEQILTKAGKALYIANLVDGLEALGRFTNKRSLNSTLLQDGKKRFVLLGSNIFDLRSRQPHSLFPELSVDSNVSRKREKRSFALMDAIRDIVKKLNSKVFTLSEMFDELQTKFPNEIDESRRRSVNSTLNNLILKGELEKVRVGKFDKPALFKIKQ